MLPTRSGNPKTILPLGPNPKPFAKHTGAECGRLSRPPEFEGFETIDEAAV